MKPAARSEPTTLVELLQRRALCQADDLAYVFLHGDGREAALTYGELDRQARAISVAIGQRARPGDRAFLLYPPGLEFIAGFFGCLYGGVVAVATYPPSGAGLTRGIRGLQVLAEDARPAVALTTSKIVATVEHADPQAIPSLGMSWIATDGVDLDAAAAWSGPEVTVESLAFLQYTSGSTASPKGVMVSHGNVMANERMIQRAFEHTEASTYVSWLPVQHDMGLIGNVLQSMYIGALGVLLSPVTFLKSPLRWLQAITDYKGRTSGGPNFAYDLCCRKISPEQRQSLDLSSWQIAFNGSERVRHETMIAFSQAFESCGFRPEAFYPCYGLAEATLFVSGGSKTAPPVVRWVGREELERGRAVPAEPGSQGATSVVGCGSGPPDNSVIVVDPRTRTLREDGAIGEISIAGPIVTHGYWNRPDQAAATFRAQLADGTPGRFLRTGDLGFIEDGELFVTGRLKDLVIIRGTNHYPEDIELTAAKSHDALRPSCGAAFSVDVAGEERLVLVNEVDSGRDERELSDVISTIRLAVAEEHDVQPYSVVLIRRGTIAKTASGKVQRHACKTAFTAGSLKVSASRIFENEPVMPQRETFVRNVLDTVREPATRRRILELYLQEQTARLRVGPADMALDESLYALGFDSLSVVELQHLIERSLDVVVKPTSWGTETLRGIAAHLNRLLGEAREETPGVVTDMGAITHKEVAREEHPLSYGQKALWFLHHLAPESQAYVIARSVRVQPKPDSPDLDVHSLEAAFQALVDRHASLRTSFTAVDGDPVYRVANRVTVDFEACDASGWSVADVHERLAEEARRPFNLEQPRPLRVRVFRRSEREHVMLLAVHHIAVDFWSLAILLSELGMLYTASRTGVPPTLPALALEYADFVRQQAGMLRGLEGQRHWAYWQKQLAAPIAALHLPTACPRPQTQTSGGTRQRFSLSEDVTVGLKRLAKEHGATLQTVCLTAFQVHLFAYSQHEEFLVGCAMAGRNRSDFSRVVGYFVNLAPVRADLSGNPTFASMVGRAQDTVTAALEHQDYPFTLLVDRLKPMRDSSSTPLFRVVFLWHRAPTFIDEGTAYFALGVEGARIEIGELALQSMPLSHEASQFDLMLIMADGPGQLEAAIEYDDLLFDQATMADMTRSLGRLFERIVAMPGATVAQLAEEIRTEYPVVPTSTDGDHVAPLTYHQERLWFVDQFETGQVYESNPTYYNIPLLLALRGPVDGHIVEESLNAVIARHDALRARIVASGERVVQCSVPSHHVPLRVVNVDTSNDSAEDRALELALEDAHRPFAVNQDFLVRASLFRIDGTRSLLALTLHHLIADEESVWIVAEELAAIYAARSGGNPTILENSAPRYADFARLLRATAEESWAPSKAFWKRQLRGELPALTLPSTRVRPAIQTFIPARCYFSIAPGLAAALRSLARERSVSEFVVYFAAFAVLLERYSGQDEMIIGTTVQCRAGTPWERVVGPVDNLLALRADLSGDLTFDELVLRVHETFRLACEHRELPFDRVVQELDPEKDMSRTPYFDVVLNFEEARPATLDMHDVKAERIHTNLGYGKFDLNMSIRDCGEFLAATLVYNRDLFDPAMVEAMAHHFQVILEAMTASPRSRVSEVALSNVDEERPRYYGALTQAAGGAKTLHGLFEAHVARDPDRVALTCGHVNVSYGELDSRANQLAHSLRARGVDTEDVVAICLDRSVEMVVAVLGVLKAGAAYLPLDPQYPPERLGFMLEDANASHVVSTDALAARLPTGVRSVTLLDRDHRRIAGQPRERPTYGILPSNLAYCLYTSGSTGQPKGVLVEHKSVTSLIANGAALFGFGKDDVWVLFHSYCFDFSVWEMWGALLNGGRLVVAPYLVSRDPSAFAELIRRERVTVLNQTPSAFIQLMRVDSEDEGRALRSSLRFVILGGETLDPHVLEGWFDRHGDRDTSVINMYGITETTVHVTYLALTALDARAGLGRAIGVPLPEIEVRLLDRYQQEVPLWVPGEIHVGGSGVCRGYLNRPSLTAESFIPNPFDQEPGSRLYRSGDIARRLPGGRLEFLGRRDHQVKIRGFRIELGEIEAQLRQHPSLRDAVVVAGRDHFGDVTLVGYVVPEGRDVPSVTELRTYLKQKLPEYMVPSSITPIERLPTGATGKVDRLALPAPDRMPRQLDEPRVLPRTPTEQALVKLWGDILDVSDIGVEDDFFELGGQSLLATKMISRVRDKLAVDVPLRVLFEERTVSRLAAAIDRIDDLGDPAAGPGTRIAPLVDAPLSFAQQRLWFLEQLEPGSPVSNVPAALHLKGTLDVATLDKCLSEIVRRHEVLRTSFRTVNGIPRQVVGSPSHMRVPVVDLRAAVRVEDNTVRARSLEIARKPFDLTKDLLLRPALLWLADEEYILLLTMHHIASDGWSSGVLTRELASLYTAVSRSEPPDLPRLPVQYAEYATWQRETLQGERLERELAFWRSQLAGSPALLELPTDRPRRAVQSFEGAHELVALPTALVEAIKSLGHSEKATLFMTLLAAFQAFLFRYTGQDDIVVGTPMANRTRTEIEGLIGFFVNTLALRTDLSGRPSFRQLLQRVREVTLRAYMHQDFPFEKLVEELKPDRALSHNPLFQSMLVLQNAPVPTLQVPGLTIDLFEHENGISKFDFSLGLTETSEGLEGWVEYSVDLFDRATIQRMIHHFRTFLEGIVADPNRSIGTFPLVTDLERQQLLRPRAVTGQFPDRRLHQLFQMQAARQPDAAAISFRGRTTSYAQLDAESNRIAHGLLAVCQLSQPIALLLEHGPSEIASMLGVLKAGSPFVCLDPSLPPARIAQILEDVKPTLLLSQSSCSGSLAAIRRHGIRPALRVILVDGTDAEGEDDESTDTGSEPQRTWAEGCPETDPGELDNAASLAYIVYTSGSTGNPKGIAQSHRSACQFMEWQSRYFDIGRGSRVMQWASTTYDASYCEIFGALCFGATLVVLERETRTDAAAVVAAATSDAVSWLQVVPSFARHILDAIELGGSHIENPLASVRNVMLAGEVVPVELAQRWSRRFPEIKLFNLYGPSETVLATCHPIDAVDLSGGSIPIGQAIDGREILILDPEQQLCPIGVKGEIYVRSDFLSTGYYRRPEETAQRFLRNPLGDDSDDLVYRTGDVGRWRADGTLEFHGRVDNQVKIRGVRVELEEIEAVLSRHEAVQECAVLAHEDGECDRRLAAYVVPRADGRSRMEVESVATAERVHVTQYEAVYDSIYRETDAFADFDPTLSMRVWTSSFRSRPFSKEEILECVTDSVNRILRMEPERVLDVGCGTGMLLMRIAPHCREYWGTDISSEALRYLRNQCDALPADAPEIRLLHQSADDFRGVKNGFFDLVILNDVAIYFPSIDYLVRVLREAASVVRPGGAVFVGGLRNLSLLEAFHTAVELDRAPDEMPREELIERVRASVAGEKELLIDPAFFRLIGNEIPAVKASTVSLKRGRHHNEVTQFQYDVVLNVGEATEVAPRGGVEGRDGKRWDWKRDGLTLEAIRQSLAEGRSPRVEVVGVPNARLAHEWAAMRLLSTTQVPSTAGELKAAAREASSSIDGVDPEEFWALAEELSYSVEISWTDGADDGSYDAAFSKHGAVASTGLAAPAWACPDKPWRDFANRPAKPGVDSGLEAGLMEFLKAELPVQMLPSAVVVLNDLPHTVSGKVDRQALPRVTRRRAISGHVVAPQNELEASIAEVWQDILNVESVSVEENFFDLGGHSLLATQVINAVRQRYSVDIPLRVIFEEPTVAGLARRIDALRPRAGGQDAEMRAILERVEAMSADETASLLEKLRRFDETEPEP